LNLLIDVDSTIPNLALMKVSTWAKRQGEQVKLQQLNGKLTLLSTDPASYVWISAIFTWNRRLAETVRDFYVKQGCPTVVGGTGVSLVVKLPPEVEEMVPDYQLYKNAKGKYDDRAIGFVQRGCIRACTHCVVPKKEGRLSQNVYRPLETWVPEGFSKVLLLDNEFAACPWDKEGMETAKSHDWKLSITQGYDLRCVTREKAAMLAEWKPYDLKFRNRTLYVAWDYFAIEPYVYRGIQTLLDAGFKGREVTCYCLCGANTSHFQDVYRFYKLWKDYKVYPFFMRYNFRKDDRFLNNFARYVNRGPASYRNHDLPSYFARRCPDLYNEASGLWTRCENGEHPSLEIPYQMPYMETLYA